MDKIRSILILKEMELMGLRYSLVRFTNTNVCYVSCIVIHSERQEISPPIASIMFIGDQDQAQEAYIKVIKEDYHYNTY